MRASCLFCLLSDDARHCEIAQLATCKGPEKGEENWKPPAAFCIDERMSGHGGEAQGPIVTLDMSRSGLSANGTARKCIVLQMYRNKGASCSSHGMAFSLCVLSPSLLEELSKYTKR